MWKDSFPDTLSTQLSVLAAQKKHRTDRVTPNLWKMTNPQEQKICTVMSWPVMPFCPFWGKGSPTEIEYRKKGTLILPLGSCFPGFPFKRPGACVSAHQAPEASDPADADARIFWGQVGFFSRCVATFLVGCKEN